MPGSGPPPTITSTRSSLRDHDGELHHEQVATPIQIQTKPGASWKADEEQVLPHNNMFLVFTSLMLTLFLVCPAFQSALIYHLSQTLVGYGSNYVGSLLGTFIFISCFRSVATALPTITAELGGGQNYSWVGR